MESLGVGGDIDESDEEDGDEEDEEDGDEEEEDDDEGGGGRGRVQLDMLDSEGTVADPALCARKATRFLFMAVIDGYGRGGQGRSSLEERMKPLVEHGILTREHVREFVDQIFQKGNYVDFSGSVERYDERDSE